MADYPQHLSTHSHDGGSDVNWNQVIQEIQELLENANQAAVGPSTDGYRCQWRVGNMLCLHTSATFDDLIVHLGRIHDLQGPRERKLRCQWESDNAYCGGEYRRDGFRRHIGTHVGLSVACPASGCNKTFSRPDSMQAHYKREHETQ